MANSKKPNRARKKIPLRLLEEYELLEQKAKKLELSKFDYLRNMIIYGMPHRRTNFTPEDSQALIYGVNRIGNNLNQIAFVSNFNKSVSDEEFQNLYQLYHELLSKKGDNVNEKKQKNYFSYPVLYSGLGYSTFHRG